MASLQFCEIFFKQIFPCNTQIQIQPYQLIKGPFESEFQIESCGFRSSEDKNNIRQLTFAANIPTLSTYRSYLINVFTAHAPTRMKTRMQIGLVYSLRMSTTEYCAYRNGLESLNGYSIKIMDTCLGTSYLQCIHHSNCFLLMHTCISTVSFKLKEYNAYTRGFGCTHL